MLREPFYDPHLSFEANVDRGPFGAFASETNVVREGEPTAELFGHPLYQPFGIPAGPVMNARFVGAAFRAGFDVVVYKTVRSIELASHPWPNILPIDLDTDLTLERASQPVVTTLEFRQPLSITNSFGVPSLAPDVWQSDLHEAVVATGPGQLLIGSFQGTKSASGEQDAFVADYAHTAQLVAKTGVPVLETNLSCPNEGSGNLVCFDLETTEAIVRAIKTAVPHRPLILKLAYFEDQSILREFVTRVGGLVEGLAAINTIPVTVITAAGEQALPGEGRRVSGICGAAIKWAGLDMVKRLVALRDTLSLDYRVIGVGGVTNPADYLEYRALGADAVLSATGSIWNPLLAQEIWGSAEAAKVRSGQWQTTPSNA